MKMKFSLSVTIGSYGLVKHGQLNLILNSVPTFSSLEQVTLPPICSIICLQIERPRPVPLLFLSAFSANLLKLRKSLLRPSLEMPVPVSIMFISNVMYYFTISSNIDGDIA